MKKNPKKKSITLRLFSTVFVVVLLLNVLSVIGTLGLSEASRRNIIQEYSYALSLYMNQMDRELSQAQTRMYELSRSNTYNTSMLADDAGKDAFEIMRTRTQLTETLNAWLGQFPMIDGYFILQPETGLLIICGGDSSYVLELTDKLSGGTGLQSDGRWHLNKQDSYGQLIFASAYHDTVYGANGRGTT